MLCAPLNLDGAFPMVVAKHSDAKMNPEQLAINHLPLVNHCLKRARSRFPDLPNDTTLQGIAREALWKAALRYEPNHGASFKTYAYYRVMGSLLDARRRQYRSRDTLAAAQARKLSDDALLHVKANANMAPPPDDHADKRRKVRGILDAADRVLGTFTLDVVKRHVLEGQSLRALAQSLNVSYRSVLRRYKQGLARLRAEWGSKAPTG